MSRKLHTRVVLAFTLMTMGSALAGCGGSGGNIASASADFTAATTQAAEAVDASMREVGPPLTGKVAVNFGFNKPMLPGQPAEWNPMISDEKTGQRVFSFDDMDGHEMNLFSISRDLSTMAHLHPVNADGSFDLDVNQVSRYQDNEDAPHAAPKAGPLLLFAELKVSGKPISLVRMDLTVQGQEQPVPLRLDPTAADGSVTKFFTADGKPGKQGDPFRARLLRRQGEGDILLSFTIQAFDARTATYKDVTDLEEWSGHLGHAVLVSELGNTSRDKIFKHLMPMGTGINKGPALTFILLPDFELGQTFKVWVQTKRLGQLVAFPFVMTI